ncbi:MAG: hypothetical protein H6Q85_2173, partial [candidate division NC10 bacterium]|nr:hypothetical protein [candidate division NC10 bacterium]
RKRHLDASERARAAKKKPEPVEETAD